MSGINARRVVPGGLVAGLVADILSEMAHIQFLPRNHSVTRPLAAALLLATLGACSSEPTLSTRPGFRGRVVISVILQGNGFEPNGFTWVIGQTRSGRVGAGQPLTVSDVAEGAQTVRLVEVPPHCSVREPNQTVTVSDGATASVDFVVECFGGFAYTGWYSPFDQQIFYLSEDGTLRKLTQLMGRNMAREFSPDGTRLLFENDTNGNIDLYSVRIDGSDLRRLTTHPYADESPRWSPDGGRVLFSRREPGGTTSSLHVVSLAGAQELPVMAPYHRDSDASWTQRAAEIVFSCDRFGRAYDLCIAKWDGSNVRSLATFPSLQHVRLSPDGVHVALLGQANVQSLYVMALSGGSVRRLTPEVTQWSFAQSFDWSPDGERLVVEMFIERFRLHHVNRDGTDFRELVQDSVPLRSPRWSPDGEWIAYVRQDGSDQAAWIVRADGSGARRLTGGFPYTMNVIWNPKARPARRIAMATVSAAGWP